MRQINKFVSFVSKFMGKEEEGATMVEYGIMVALIAVVAIGAVNLIGTNVTATFNAIAAAV